MIDSDEVQDYSIKEEIERYYEKEMNHRRLGGNLDRLVDKGLLKKNEKNRRSNSYTITQRGRHEIKVRKNWEREYLEPKSMIP